MDVSTRAFGFFLGFERKGRLDIARLLVGLPVTRAELEDPRRRIPWEVWVEICERFARTLGSPEEVEASGAAVLDPGYLGPLRGVVGLFTDPADIYRVGLRWFAPAMYKNLRFSMERFGPSGLDITIEIPEGQRESEAFMRMTAGGLRAIPRLLGLHDAIVEAQVTPRRGRFLVTLPAARTVRSLLARAWAALRGADAVITELTEQQARLSESYAALARAERGFRSVLEALPIAVGVHRAGRLLYTNSALTRLDGRDAAALFGEPVAGLVLPSDRTRLEALLRQPNPTSTVEVRLAGAGAPVFVECGVLDGFVFDGYPAGLFFAIDLTARRAAQQALARSEEINGVLLALLPDLVLRVNRDGVLLDYRAGKGHPNTHILPLLRGLSVYGFAEHLSDLPRQMIETGMARVREALETRREVSYDVRSSATADHGHYDCRIFPMNDDEVLVLARDVSEQHRQQEQLAITERMATLGTVAAGVAHELNNPLTYVIANLALSLQELEANGQGAALDVPTLKQNLADAMTGAERVKRIVGELRVFSRAGHNDERRPIDVREVLSSVLAMTSSELRARAQVRVDIDSTTRVDADPSRLGQVFVNLVMNAAHAIPEHDGGAHEIRVVASVGGDGWQEVSVRDDGVGIPADTLPQIFQPFVTTKQRQGGTGLGLAICHRIVTELGGRIEVESAVGVGSTFRVRLPPSAQPASEPGAPSAATGEHPRGRILVVDDEPLVGRAIMRMLASHEVTLVASGEEALPLLRAHDFDLVVCDVTLGGMSGLDLRAEVRRERPALAERFLFISGGALTAAARDLVAAEPERCISKPVSPLELRARVDSELGRQRA